MKKLKNLALYTGLMTLLFFSNCKKAESPEPVIFNHPTDNPTVPPNPYNPPAVTFSAPVIGFVEDVNGNPIQGAIVSTGGKTATTDANGAFEIASAPFTGDFCYIKSVKNGYFFGSATLHGKAGYTFTTHLVMQPQDNIVSFKATEAKTIALQGGATVEFPANAIKNLDGKPYTGNVNVAVAYIDPVADNFTMQIPGGDLRGYDVDGKDVQLRSFGMMNVELRDDAGNYLQLADGIKSTLTMPLPANMQVGAPAAIPLWYFDDNKGVWIEEGAATLNNGIYTGTVSHFTAWNLDWKGPRAYIKGKIKDCEGEIVSGYYILTDRVRAEVNEKGEWERWVPAGMDIEVGVYAYRQNKSIKLNVKVPALKAGEVIDVGEIVIPCLSKIKGKIKDCDDKPFTGYITIVSDGKTFREFVCMGDLNLITEGTGRPAKIYFYVHNSGQLHTLDFMMPSTGTTINLGDVKACPPKTIPVEFKFDYNDGSSTKTIKFNNIQYSSAEYFMQLNKFNINYTDVDNSGGDSLTTWAAINFPDPKTGTGTIDSLGITQWGKWTMYVHPTTSITFTVNKYENVAGEISGTFSGTMLMVDNVAQTSKVVTVTNGKYSAVRLPDR